MRKIPNEELCRPSADEVAARAKMPVVVVLDNVRSAQNAGSFFRTCDAFGVERLALCGITAAPPSRDIHKTALGAELTVAWSYHATTAECLSQLREEGYRILAVEQVEGAAPLDTVRAAQATAQPAVPTQPALAPAVPPASQPAPTQAAVPQAPAKYALVFGNEVDGVAQPVVDLCDGAIEIPQTGAKHSLNVSVAGGIVLWEFFCQIHPKHYLWP